MRIPKWPFRHPLPNFKRGWRKSAPFFVQRWQSQRGGAGLAGFTSISRGIATTQAIAIA